MNASKKYELYSNSLLATILEKKSLKVLTFCVAFRFQTMDRTEKIKVDVCHALIIVVENETGELGSNSSHVGCIHFTLIP